MNRPREEIAHEIEMIHSLLQRFPAAEHHRRGSSHAEFVSGAMDIDPFLRAAFQPADAMPYVVVEDFCPASRNRVQP